MRSATHGDMRRHGRPNDVAFPRHRRAADASRPLPKSAGSGVKKWPCLPRQRRGGGDSFTRPGPHPPEQGVVPGQSPRSFAKSTAHASCQRVGLPGCPPHLLGHPMSPCRALGMGGASFLGFADSPQATSCRPPGYDLANRTARAFAVGARPLVSHRRRSNEPHSYPFWDPYATLG